MNIQPADPAHRRRVVRILSATAIILLAAVVAFKIWLRTMSAQRDAASLIALIKPMFGMCVISIAACIVALGAHLVVRGRRIVLDRRYPARDARVMRDTSVREGIDAVRMGMAGQIGGWVFCALGFAIAIFGMLWVRNFG